MQFVFKLMINVELNNKLNSPLNRLILCIVILPIVVPAGHIYPPTNRSVPGPEVCNGDWVQ